MFALNRKHLIIVSAWVGTAVFAYSLGQSIARDAAIKAAEVTRKGAGGGSNWTAATHPTGTDPEADRASNGSVDALDTGNLTTEKVTGGQPMDEWLQRLLSDEDEIIRMTGFLRLLETLNTSEDLKAAIKAVSAVPGRDRGARSREFSMLLEKWTQLDPEAAVAYAAALKGNDERLAVTSTVLRKWARTTPEEALAWAEANGRPTNDQEGNWSVAAVVSQLARTDIDRALEVAGGQDPSRARGRAMETLVNELISQRGDDAAQAAVEGLPAGNFRDSLTAELADRLADSNAPAAARWALTLPSGDGRARALAETVDEWSDDDVIAAGKFMAALPMSPDTDLSRERYARNVLRRDPEGALAWADTISHDEQRDRTTENLFREWMKRDFNAAKIWLAHSQLPDPVKAKLLPPTQ